MSQRSLQLLARAGALLVFERIGTRPAGWLWAPKNATGPARRYGGGRTWPVALPRPSVARKSWRLSQLSLSTTEHPLRLLRQRLRALGAQQQPRAARAARRFAGACRGLVTHLQQPGTASGVVFLSLEDETGIVNVILCAGVCRLSACRPSRQASGGWRHMQNQHGVTHVVARISRPFAVACRDSAPSPLTFH
jgi:error-prone DNA polymerase